MKISELIFQLEEIKLKCGDLQVYQFSEESNWIVEVDHADLDYCGFEYVFLVPSEKTFFDHNKDAGIV